MTKVYSLDWTLASVKVISGNFIQTDCLTLFYIYIIIKTKNKMPKYESYMIHITEVLFLVNIG